MVDIQNVYYNYRVVENDLSILLRFVDLTKENYVTNGAEIRKLILASCSLIESCLPQILAHIQSSEKNEGESIAGFISRITNDKEYNLENLQPLIQLKKFNPWGNFTSWWSAYNAIKHHERNQDGINFFQAAVESVLALFVLVVLLTSKTSIKIFWNEHDLVKISIKGSNKGINYLQNESLEQIFLSKKL